MPLNVTDVQFDVQHYVKLRCDAIEKVLAERDLRYEARFEAQEYARELQAKEYERRLDTLNHEAERLKEMQSTYLPRGEAGLSQKMIEDRVGIIETFRIEQKGRGLGQAAIIASIVTSIVVSGILIGIISNLTKIIP